MGILKHCGHLDFMNAGASATAFAARRKSDRAFLQRSFSAGLDRRSRIHDLFVQLQPDDVLVMFSDGSRKLKRGAEVFGDRAAARSLVRTRLRAS